MRSNEEIINGYQALYLLNKTIKAQISMAMEECAKIKMAEFKNKKCNHEYKRSYYHQGGDYAFKACTECNEHFD